MDIFNTDSTLKTSLNSTINLKELTRSHFFQITELKVQSSKINN